MARERNSNRGAALLVVMTLIAVTTALAVDTAYNARVSLQIAANGRDELRAYSLAKGAVNISRLVLHFQRMLDGGGAQGGAALPGGALPAFRLWEVVPVDSSVATMFPRGVEESGSGARPRPKGEGAEHVAPPPEEGAPHGAGGLDGSFQARIEDEDRKIDLPQLAGLMQSSGLPGAQLTRLMQLVGDPKYDFLFDREDESGNRPTRADMICAMRDWVDEDEVSSAIAANPPPPFEQGFSDENFAYQRYAERYRAKNARFDSLDELYLVYGVSDAFMAAFGDRLTVFPDVNATTNVNTSDPMSLLVNTLTMSDPPGKPQLPVLDPAFIQKLQAVLDLLRPLPFMSITVQQFAEVLRQLGVKVLPVYLQPNNPASAYGDRSSTFRIRATGLAGGVRKRLEVVVTTDKRAGALAQDLGRVLHWKEE